MAALAAGAAPPAASHVPAALRDEIRTEASAAFHVYAVPVGGASGAGEKPRPSATDVLPREQLGAFMRALGQTPTDAELADLLLETGLSDAPTLTLADVQRLVDTQLTATYTAERDMLSAFEALDTDGDGFIGRAELVSVLQSMGHTPTEADVDAMFRLGAASGSDRMSLDGFRAAVGAGAGAAPGAGGRGAAAGALGAGAGAGAGGGRR